MNISKLLKESNDIQWKATTLRKSKHKNTNTLGTIGTGAPWSVTCVCFMCVAFCRVICSPMCITSIIMLLLFVMLLLSLWFVCFCYCYYIRLDLFVDDMHPQKVAHLLDQVRGTISQTLDSNERVVQDLLRCKTAKAPMNRSACHVAQAFKSEGPVCALHLEELCFRHTGGLINKPVSTPNLPLQAFGEEAVL